MLVFGEETYNLHICMYNHRLCKKGNVSCQNVSIISKLEKRESVAYGIRGAHDTGTVISGVRKYPSHLS